MDPDANLSVLVWRRKPDGGELLEVADGKGWRLPRASEIGLPKTFIAGPIGALATAPPDFDPGRLHRWVHRADSDPTVARAFAQTGAAAIVWRPAAAGIEVLLLHRSGSGADYEGDWAWGPPGGALDPGETHLECAARELYEETGLDLPLVRLHGVVNDFAAHVAELVDDGAIALSDEHDRFEWVDIDEACVRCLPDRVADTLRAAKRHIGS